MKKDLELGIAETLVATTRREPKPVPPPPNGHARDGFGQPRSLQSLRRSRIDVRPTAPRGGAR